MTTTTAQVVGQQNKHEVKLVADTKKMHEVEPKHLKLMRLE